MVAFRPNELTGPLPSCFDGLFVLMLVPIRLHRLFCFLLSDGLRVEWMSLRSQAATGGQLELPAVHGAGEDAVLNFGEAGQVGFQMGAAALDAIAVAFPQLLHGGLLGGVTLGVLQAFGREAFEEVVDVFVVGSLTLRLEAAGEKDLVDPGLFMMG